MILVALRAFDNATGAEAMLGEYHDPFSGYVDRRHFIGIAAVPTRDTSKSS